MMNLPDDKSIQESAAKVVKLLLDDTPVRACVTCEIEHGIYNKSDTTKSHDLCKRHVIQWGKENFMSPEDIDEIVTSTEAGSGFPPDLGPVSKSPVKSGSPPPIQAAPPPQITARHLKTRYPVLQRFLHQQHNK